MPLWFLLTLGGVLFVSFAEIAQKIVISGKSEISAETNNFIVWGIQSFFAFIFIIFFASHDFSLLSHIPLNFLLIIPVLYFWGGTLYYSSYKEGSVSISNILVGISSVVSTFLGITFFGESSNLYKLIGLLLIIIAIVFVNYSKNQKLTRSNLLALAGGVIFGLTFTFDKRFVLNIGPHLYQFLLCFSVAAISLVFRGKKIISELKNVKIADLKVMFMSATFFFGYNKLLFWAYQNSGEVGRIDAINNTVIFFVIVLEFLILKERSNMFRKFVAAVIAFTGVTLLALAK
ncbi:MAG: EamA family transporter [Oligoflexia bacterium]|nr:EamA family transporter [Oligoflexia bacterium]